MRLNRGSSRRRGGHLSAVIRLTTMPGSHTSMYGKPIGLQEKAKQQSTFELRISLHRNLVASKTNTRGYGSSRKIFLDSNWAKTTAFSLHASFDPPWGRSSTTSGIIGTQLRRQNRLVSCARR